MIYLNVVVFCKRLALCNYFLNIYTPVPNSLFSSCSYIVTTMKKTIKLQMEGYEVVEKKAERGGNSGRIYVPKAWIGKKVRVVLIEQ